MKGIAAAVMIVGFMFFVASSVLAESTSGGTTKARTITVYNAKERCQVICKAPKPFLEIVEDGLAYALDLPLAMLSPITCPIVSPLLDKFDPVENRSYARTPSKK
jgi:hypothetical protein